MKNTELSSTEFNILVNGFERELQKENKSESHVSEHISYIKEFLSYVEANGISYIKSVDQPLITDYVIYLEQERMNQRAGGTLEETTIRKHKSSIKNFWKYLNAEGIKVNAIRLKHNKKGIQKEITVLTHQEIEQLYSVTDSSAIGYRDRCSLALYFGMGLRKSEGLKLLLTDIDFNKGMIHIRKPKNQRDRYVMMTPKIQQQIEEYVCSYRDMYLSEQSSYEELFIGERGVPICPETMAKRIKALWLRVKDRYGNEKNIGIHTLRHTCGSQLYLAGLGIDKIALMLGHHSLSTTQVYIHLSKQI